ncbi:MAG: hypothetical protein V7K63_10690 [Nostoc sp.]
MLTRLPLLTTGWMPFLKTGLSRSSLGKEAQPNGRQESKAQKGIFGQR